MADLLLSRVLDVIVDNLAAPFLEKFDNLWDLEDNIRKLRSNLPMVQAVLEDAEEQQASNGAVRIWLSKLKEVAYEAESLLLLLSADYSLRKIIKDEEKVKETIRALEMTAVEGLRFNLKEGSIVHREWDRRPETSSFGLEQRVLGREKDKEEIVKLLLSCERSRGGEASCIPIIGMGGLGKTTLAQLAYNDHEVKRHFDVQVWVFVSDQFDVKNIMRTVIESLSKDKCHYPTLDALYSEVRNLLQNKRFLIVLDDVWTENSNDWDQLRPLFTAGSDGSKILVTTRSQKVALMADSPNSMYSLKALSDDACRSLLLQRAFPQGDEEKHPTLLPIGEQIVSKCKGVALAAKTLGSLLKLKRSIGEWEIVRDSELWNLDKSKNEILPALRLSYFHLPLHLKRCFSFCSIFPRNYEFQKDKLIHLWMAEGFIQCSSDGGGKEPENVGNDYFNDLQWMSFFQDIRQGEDGVVIGYKMHDVIYDLAQSVTGTECILLDRGLPTPTSFKKIRHSAVVGSFRSSEIPEELYEAKHHLRTLLLFSGGNLEAVPKKLYSSLKCLFVLDLSGSGLGILDGSFRALYYLKYLDLSHTRITKLPHEIEGLQFLETLNLFHCYDLIELPELRKMRSLRHLNNDGCRSLTRMLNNESKYVVGFGGFTSGSCSQLRTLPLFVVGDQNDFLFLHGLRLRGSLKVTHLENATGRALGFVGVESLGLYWGTDEGCPHINLEGEYVGNQFQGRKETSTSGTRQRIQYNPSAAQWLLENYKPADSLQVLLVKNYPGKSFPSIKARGLHNLSLISCENSENVPSLENVPNLTRLLLQEFNGVKSIDRNFGQFLALKELVLVDFPMLETWLSPGGGRVVFPNLRKLVLNKCPKLTVMPQILSIQHLDLRNCPAILVHSFQNLTSLEILVIQGVRDLLHFPAMFPSNNPLLTTLEIKSCSRLRSLPGELGNLSALKSLTIQWCENLFSLPQSLQNLSTLESLEIGDCHRLTSLPQGWTRGLGNLRSLSIENCSKLSSLSMECEHLISLKTLTIMYCPTICTLPEGVEHLSALQRLSILDLPELIYLPEGLQNLSLLHSLEIGSCPSLKHLPGWIDKLVSLRSLTISDCQDLRSLPEGLTCLTALQYLSIHDCPRLLERCKQERGEDWPKIAHVPHKNIGLPKLKRPREEGSSSTN